jgi:hypothetical protein
MSSVFLKRQRSIESTISLRDVLQHPFISQEGVVPLFQAIQAGALSVSIIGKSDLGVLGEWRLGKEEWLNGYTRIWIRWLALNRSVFYKQPKY